MMTQTAAEKVREAISLEENKLYELRKGMSDAYWKLRVAQGQVDKLEVEEAATVEVLAVYRRALAEYYEARTEAVIGDDERGEEVDDGQGETVPQ